MLKRIIVLAALMGSAVVAPAVAASAAAPQGFHAAASSTVSAACTYRRDGNVWRCVTPGAYCPKAARNRYGYAKSTNRRYKCSQYTSTTWRWKRA